MGQKINPNILRLGVSLRGVVVGLMKEHIRTL